MKIRAVLATLLLVLASVSVMAVDVDTDLGITITPEQFVPRVFLDPNSRVVYDDCTEPGATTGCGDEMYERELNYAFEGERVYWSVLVWDKNGDDKISDVFVTAKMLNESGLPEEFVEVNCYRDDNPQTGLGNLTGEIYEGEEMILWEDLTMDWYICQLTVETPASMHGEHWISAYAEDVGGLQGFAAEEEFWFFNPVVALGVTGGISFTDGVRPGATVKSSALTVGNAAEASSGVMLDMYVAGTDFYDPANTGAMCPTSNVLKLSNFRYYASSGAYNTCGHWGADGVVDGVGVDDDADAECYATIPYFMTGAAPGVTNNNMQRVIDNTGATGANDAYQFGNTLSPGAEMTLNFKLALPEPCNGGSFSDGSFTFRGEAV